MVVAYLPAKGHSSRLRGKNMKMFCGKQLIAWSLIQTKYSGVDKTVVSTDDWSIANVCEQYGAEVYWRQHEWESVDEASGAVPTYFMVKHILEKYPQMDVGVSMFTTSPLRLPWDIDNCIDLCMETRRPSSIYLPRYETFIYYLKDERVMPAIMNKNFRYADLMAGLAAVPREILEQQTAPENRPNPDIGRPREMDVGSSVDSGKAIGDVAEILDWFESGKHSETQVWKERYIRGEHWQAVEIDYLEDFELAEYYMRKYILKDGEDVYERYWMAKYNRT